MFASGTEPVSSGQSIKDFRTVARLVGSSKAQITNDNLIVFAVIVPKTNIALDIGVIFIVDKFEFIEVKVVIK